MSDNKDLLTSLLLKISEQVEDTSQCVSKLDKKLDLSIQHLEFEIKKINELDNEQNSLLSEHMKRSDTLEKLYIQLKKETDNRLEQVEQPKKWLNFTTRVIITLGALAAAILSILKFYNGV